MRTRVIYQAVALSTILLLGMNAIAAACKEQSLADYVKDGSCTINGREFAGFAAKGNSIDLAKVTVTPINNADYVGLQFTGFNNRTQGIMSVRVSYTVSATEKPKVKFDQLSSRMDGITFGNFSGVLQSNFAYTVAAGTDSINLAAASDLTKSKRDDDVFNKDKQPTDIAVEASMVTMPINAQNLTDGPIFTGVRHLFSPPK